ncbi:hypothetical protein GHT06_009217 [Daphnia sinensis]|uniref:Uncharacterized protein n=1 Tax=Daphnia sinensis TaxID=1820382 RepID=A0AAD5Q3F6_9CRUS|nr:hypothetical protein GHT06_009217 [Daphnia sinensis]
MGAKKRFDWHISCAALPLFAFQIAESISAKEHLQVISTEPGSCGIPIKEKESEQFSFGLPKKGQFEYRLSFLTVCWKRTNKNCGKDWEERDRPCVAGRDGAIRRCTLAFIKHSQSLLTQPRCRIERWQEFLFAS